MDHQEAFKLFAYLTACYPNVNINDITTEIYLNLLCQFDYETAEKAIKQIVLASPFFPSLAELNQVLQNFSKKELPSINEAWNEVVREIEKIGSYGIPTFSHPVIYEAVKVIGWRNLCLSENISIERSHFMKVYETMKKRYQEEEIKEQANKLILFNPVQFNPVQERRAISGGY